MWHFFSRRVCQATQWVSCAAIIVAVAPATTSPSHAQTLSVVRYGHFRVYDPVYVGLAKGFFRDAGVDLQLTGNFTSGPQELQAAASGDVDAGNVAITGLINAVRAGIPVTGVADSQSEFAAAPLMQWLVLADSPVRSGRELAGKVIATNSLSGSFYYTALRYLRANGLSKSDVRFIVMPMEHQVEALRLRRVDVVGVIDPYSVAALQEGGVRVLFRGADVLGDRQFSLIFFRGALVRDRPDIVKRMLRGYRDSIEYIRAHPAESARLMSSALDLPASVVVHHQFTPSANVRLSDVQFWIDAMRGNGDLSTSDSLSARDVATDVFNLR